MLVYKPFCWFYKGIVFQYSLPVLKIYSICNVYCRFTDSKYRNAAEKTNLKQLSSGVVLRDAFSRGAVVSSVMSVYCTCVGKSHIFMHAYYML